MKFIHLADAHLDSPFLGLSFLPSKSLQQIQQAPNQSFTKIVDLALQEKVDLVLIAGDTFDSSRPTPSSQLFLAKEIQRLTEAQIQVVMIFGNHDHMHEADLLVKPSPYFKLLGNDEHVETASFTTKDGFTYSVSGFSYLNNHITEDKIPDFPKKSTDYHFGLMHAQEQTSKASQNVYAPFKLSEVKALAYDYFALGHIHLRQTLAQEPLIVYSGNTQGRHINELGAKGCYLGEINEETHQTKLTFVATGPIVWQSISLRLTEPISKNELQEEIIAQMNKNDALTYFSLHLVGAEFLTEDERELVQDSDFWRTISLQLNSGSFLVDVRFETNSQLEIGASDQTFFQKAEDEVFAPENLAKTIKDWAGKDELAAGLAAAPDFIKAVRELTEVKLSSRLKGVNDETDKD
ncbi:DNA repair exonuclease [Lactobacillus sp. ESL0791]|uniref:metallophosphoesterase family protein n=1 Tax=Lactobacillus sp. ESL0791 TaxID=2983234 RepID=UPI0023F7F9DB|nr:DNA repair exonuclease [Lactobacillus sp. ESL0791]MDF7638503.1 DNA repair exonuclease [Lactobacillus sp. ESL0791]